MLAIGMCCADSIWLLAIGDDEPHLNRRLGRVKTQAKDGQKRGSQKSVGEESEAMEWPARAACNSSGL